MLDAWSPSSRRSWRTSGTAGAGDLQIEIVRMLLAAGATMADTDRNGVAVADRIQSQALRNALASG
jgi:hypothetical protein